MDAMIHTQHLNALVLLFLTVYYVNPRMTGRQS